MLSSMYVQTEPDEDTRIAKSFWLSVGMETSSNRIRYLSMDYTSMVELDLYSYGLFREDANRAA